MTEVRGQVTDDRIKKEEGGMRKKGRMTESGMGKVEGGMRPPAYSRL
jgi:hypothetical protein